MDDDTTVRSETAEGKIQLGRLLLNMALGTLKSERKTEKAPMGMFLVAGVAHELSEAWTTFFLWQQWLVPLGLPALHGATHAWVLVTLLQVFMGHYYVGLRLDGLLTLFVTDKEERDSLASSRLMTQACMLWVNYLVISLLGHLFVPGAR